ncbi:MAG: outer membrane beta-barrel protein, partial [Candidatus Paceibacterota bacterium]
SGATVRNTWDINQYLMYSINDCLAIGGRYEWYQHEGIFSPLGQEDEIQALTLGLNYRPHANVVVRPEVRWDEDHSTGQTVGLEDGRDQTTFGIDTILTF